jgi:hypothetical protein
MAVDPLLLLLLRQFCTHGHFDVITHRQEIQETSPLVATSTIFLKQLIASNIRGKGAVAIGAICPDTAVPGLQARVLWLKAFKKSRILSCLERNSDDY